MGNVSTPSVSQSWAPIANQYDWIDHSFSTREREEISAALNKRLKRWDRREKKEQERLYGIKPMDSYTVS